MRRASLAIMVLLAVLPMAACGGSEGTIRRKRQDA